MPYRYALRFGEGFTFVRFEGAVAGSEVLAVQQIIFDAGRPQGVCSVWDTCAITRLDVAPSDLPAYKQLLHRHRHQLGQDERVAVIASEELEQVMAEMFIAVARSTKKRPHRIVASLEAAAEWTGLPVDVLRLPDHAFVEPPAP